MKKLFSILLCLLMLTVLPLSAGAVPNYVVDLASLMTDDEIRVLEEKCASFYNEYGMELVFVTADSLDGKSARDYADDFYDQVVYGDDGILFLLAMEEREWYISTAGNAISALSDYDLMELGDEILPYLSAGRYHDAFYHFQSILPDFLKAESQAAGGYQTGPQFPDHEPEPRVNLMLSIILGGVIAGVVLIVMASSMNTKRAQRGASSYQRQGSYRLTQHQDLFLYSNVSKRPRPQNTGGPGGHRGGSSVHRSSGGRSHGGRGGRF